MLVQSYSDKDYARLFIDDLVVDLKLHALRSLGAKDTERLKTIDGMMHEVGFYRRQKWQKTDWGWEAKIRRRKT